MLGGAGRSSNPHPPMFILMSGQNSRSKVPAVSTVTSEPRLPDITQTPEEKTTVAPGMLTRRAKIMAADGHMHICQDMDLFFICSLLIYISMHIYIHTTYVRT